MRFRLAALVGLLFLVGLAVPASACLWDRDTEVKEREFRSNYYDNQQSPPKNDEGFDGPGWVSSHPAGRNLLGVGLLVGAVGLTVVGVRYVRR